MIITNKWFFQYILYNTKINVVFYLKIIYLFFIQIKYIKNHKSLNYILNEVNH